MRLDSIFTPASLVLTVSRWPRAEIENAIEQLIEVLDAGDTLLVEMGAGAGGEPGVAG